MCHHPAFKETFTVQFGLTHKEREAREKAGTQHFALWPTRLTDGRWVWLEFYRRRSRPAVDRPWFARRMHDFYYYEAL